MFIVLLSQFVLGLMIFTSAVNQSTPVSTTIKQLSWPVDNPR